MSTVHPMTARQRFIAAVERQPVDRPPVWIMRQAGRYLPEYRAIRSKNSFLQMVHTPEVAAEVTLQPIRRFGFDAAILFSDILTIPEAMGMRVDFPEGGPVLEPVLRTEQDIERLRPIDPHRDLGFVADALAILRRELGDKAALLGFSGAPWTLACYMIEGRGSRNFENAKTLLYREPALMRRLLDQIADAVIGYLQMQLDAGADAVQVFDTWAGELQAADYEAVVRPSTERIVRTLRGRGGRVMLFARHAGHLLDSTLACGASAVSLDWRLDLADVARRAEQVAGHPALQGNLDPIELFAPADRITQRIRAMHQAVGGGSGWVVNLGHGVIPSTPISGVEALVAAVHGLRSASIAPISQARIEAGAA